FTYVDPLTYLNQQDITVNVPAALAPGPCTIEVELCDCDQCEFLPGTGRCAVSRFPVLYAPTSDNVADGGGSLAGIDGRATIAGPTMLFAPYPNPASRGATVRFNLARSAEAKV